MKAYQKYVKEHQDEINEVLLNLLYILDRPDEYEDYDQHGFTSCSDKLKSISKDEYATLYAAKRSLDIMTRHNIEITLNIAYEIGYAARYCAHYTPQSQFSIELCMHLHDVSKTILDKTHKAHMKEISKGGFIL